jgi:hypothetical protein
VEEALKPFKARRALLGIKLEENTAFASDSSARGDLHKSH